MKKVLILTSVLALAACSYTLEQHDADFAGCERVDTSEKHLVYKCPADMAIFDEVKTIEPNTFFFEKGALVWDEVNADKEHIYVEVVLDKEAAEDCDEDFHYRVMVKPFNMKTMEVYAVAGCK